MGIANLHTWKKPEDRAIQSPIEIFGAAKDKTVFKCSIKGGDAPYKMDHRQWRALFPCMQTHLNSLIIVLIATIYWRETEINFISIHIFFVLVKKYFSLLFFPMKKKPYKLLKLLTYCAPPAKY